MNSLKSGYHYPFSPEEYEQRGLETLETQKKTGFSKRSGWKLNKPLVLITHADFVKKVLARLDIK